MAAASAGMGLLLLASLALVIDSYVLRTAVQPAITAGYWTLMALALLAVYTSWALSRRLISYALGSAAAMTAWWLLAYLTLGRLPTLSFGSTLALYVVLVVAISVVLYLIRLLVLYKR